MEHVLITGASRGLGYELLKAFSKRGCATFPLVRSIESAEELARTFVDCYPIVADLTNDDAIGKIFSVLGRHTDKLDVLVNNAGISGKEYRIEAVKTEEVASLFDIHCLGPIRAVQGSLPFLRKSVRPRICNISSRLGSLQKMSAGEFKHRNFSYSYRMAKAAQNMFTICLSQELEEAGIAVCAIHPGQLLTRGGSTDADTDPAVATEKICDLAQKLDMGGTGRYVQPDVGELPW